MAKVHALKTWPGFFEAIVTGRKTCEVRLNDRNFEVGDKLDLQEYDPKEDKFTGSDAEVCVTHIVSGGAFGIDPSYVVMSTKLVAVRIPCPEEMLNSGTEQQETA